MSDMAGTITTNGRDFGADIDAVVVRIVRLEKAASDMAQSQANLHTTITENTAKLDHILDFLTKANSAWGFVRRHGPKIGYVVVGVAISRGWITTENGKNILHVLGV